MSSRPSSQAREGPRRPTTERVSWGTYQHTTPASTRLLERVVIPVEGSDREFVAQQWAIEFAASMGVSARAVHVTRPGADGPSDVFAYVRRAAEKWAVPLETMVLESENPVDEFVQELTVRDVAVIGTRRLSKTYHVGSFAAALVQFAPCPVLMVRLK